MLSKLCALFVTVLVVAVPSADVHAQAVIHALSGTAKSVGQRSGSLFVVSADGTSRTFDYDKNAKSMSTLDSSVRSATVAPAAFSKSGDQVIVYYYFGTQENPIAIAVDDLGAGPFAKENGVVTHFDKHSRTLTLRLSSGAEQSFKISEKTVADTSEGLVDGRKFDPDKGAVARVIVSPTDTTNTVLFVKTRVD